MMDIGAVWGEGEGRGRAGQGWGGGGMSAARGLRVYKGFPPARRFCQRGNEHGSCGSSARPGVGVG
jgi:hypothetical protein